MRELLIGSVLATMAWSVAAAETRTIHLDTTLNHISRWTVYEITNGQIVSAPAAYFGANIWGKVPSLTVPFTNCDGYWYAKRAIHIPVGATNIVLKITRLGVDDRAVILVNHIGITGVGTTAKGAGQMQFHDPGQNRNYIFQFIAGRVSFTDTTHLQPGRNEIRVIVNNTNEGIHGTIQPINQYSPSGFGIAATITYTP